MSLEGTSKLHPVGSGRYAQLYLERDLVGDSQFPFQTRDATRVRIVDAGERSVLVVTALDCSVDLEASEIELEPAPGFDSSAEDVDVDVDSFDGGTP